MNKEEIKKLQDKMRKEDVRYYAQIIFTRPLCQAIAACIGFVVIGLLTFILQNPSCLLGLHAVLLIVEKIKPDVIETDTITAPSFFEFNNDQSTNQPLN